MYGRETMMSGACVTGGEKPAMYKPHCWAVEIRVILTVCTGVDIFQKSTGIVPVFREGGTGKEWET